MYNSLTEPCLKKNQENLSPSQYNKKLKSIVLEFLF